MALAPAPVQLLCCGALGSVTPTASLHLGCSQVLGQGTVRHHAAPRRLAGSVHRRLESAIAGQAGCACVLVVCCGGCGAVWCFCTATFRPRGFQLDDMLLAQRVL
jgi:hypothetical protein